MRPLARSIKSIFVQYRHLVVGWSSHVYLLIPRRHMYVWLQLQELLVNDAVRPIRIACEPVDCLTDCLSVHLGIVVFVHQQNRLAVATWCLFCVFTSNLFRKRYGVFFSPKLFHSKILIQWNFISVVGCGEKMRTGSQFSSNVSFEKLVSNLIQIS